MVLFVLFISTIFVFVLFNKFVVQSVVYLLIGKSEAGRKCIYFYLFIFFLTLLLAYNFLLIANITMVLFEIPLLYLLFIKNYKLKDTFQS